MDGMKDMKRKNGAMKLMGKRKGDRKIREGGKRGNEEIGQEEGEANRRQFLIDKTLRARERGRKIRTGEKRGEGERER